MQRPVDTEYSSTAQSAMQGSVEAGSASEAQPEKRPQGAHRAVDGRGIWQVMAAGAIRGSKTGRGGWGASGASRVWSPAELKDSSRCESEVGRRPGRRRDRSTRVERITTGRPDARSSRCRSDVRAGRAEDTKPIRAGSLAVGRAGVRSADASRRFCAGAARGATPA